MSTSPQPGQRVRLDVLDWDVELEARVDQSTGRTIAISLPTDGTVPYVVPVGRAVVVVWTSERGPARAQGQVVGRVAGSTPLLAIELVEAPDVLQRREHVRARAYLDVELRTPDGSAPLRATTYDVSGGGIRAGLATGLDPDESALLTIHLPDGAPITLEARAVRRADDLSVGMRFELIAAPDRERLIRYVFAQLRDSLEHRLAR